MKHLFVPYNISILAKEKGFDELCCAYFQPNLEGRINEFFIADMNEDWECNSENHMILTRPMYQQIVDWFREKHNIIITVDKSKSGYYYDLNCLLDTTKSNYGEGNTEAYYQSLNIAIEEAFKLI